MTILIRKAVEEDALDIGTLHTLSWQVAYKGIIHQSFLDEIDALKRVEKWRKVLQNRLLTKTVLVAEFDERIVGFASGDVVEEYADHYYMHALYLHPSYVEKGIGKVLMNEFKECVRQQGFQKMVCTVLTANKRARHFYEREGGVHQAGETKFFKTQDGIEYPEEVYYFEVS
jgi:GNAT superfamily N-acetyltransferase